MDEQDPRSTEPTPGVPAEAAPDANPEVNPARFGAPLPPPAWSSATPPVPPRRRGPRVFAVGTALAVVAGAAGAGFLLGRVDDHGHPEAGSPRSGYAGQVPNGQGFGETPFGGTPFTGPGGRGTPFDSASSGTPATDSQLTGLVRIASTLKYQSGRAAGTGMILTSTGEVVTNHHVVEGVDPAPGHGDEHRPDLHGDRRRHRRQGRRGRAPARERQRVADRHARHRRSLGRRRRHRGRRCGRQHLHLLGRRR